jgi:hypothetical protein
MLVLHLLAQLLRESLSAMALLRHRVALATA